MKIDIVPVLDPLPSNFDALCLAARLEGHSHLDRLASEWQAGVNRFANTGESLLAALLGGTLAGVGGITIDTADSAALRMRRFYVDPACRRRGVARRLAAALLLPVRQAVVLNAPGEAAARFWEALGFVPDRRDGHTHILRPPH